MSIANFGKNCQFSKNFPTQNDNRQNFATASFLSFCADAVFLPQRLANTNPTKKIGGKK
jgi:hypothetical protein